MRYFAIAIVCMVLLGAAGYLVRDHLFRSSASTPATTTSARRSAPPPPATVTTTPAAAAVIDVHGRVERRTPAGWAPVVAGDHLSLQDTIRTAEDASAQIDVGGTPVELADRSEITVVDISRSVSEISLGEGRVSASPGAAGGPRIRIEARGTGAIAEAEAGRFDMISSGTGHVTVAAETGDVRVTAHGESVEVHAGEQAFVRDGAAPTAPTQIPPSLFLKVRAAGGPAQVAILHGETTPGAIVSVDGHRTGADDHGLFDATVPLRDGANAIVVLVEDATGRRERKVIHRSVDDHGPRVKTEVTW